MPSPNAYISLHDVHTISAFDDVSFGNPLMLSIDGAHGKLRLAIFFSDRENDYSKRLADAINAVPRTVKEVQP
jgi:hypothetical protein